MDEAGRKKLWTEYDKSRTPELREKIILEYAPLVKLVAGRLSMYLGYNVEYDDLVSYGIFGLIDAIVRILLSPLLNKSPTDDFIFNLFTFSEKMLIE